MTDEQQQILIMVDDDLSGETREMIQTQLSRRGLGHILVVAAGLAAISSRMVDVLEDFRRIQASIHDLSPLLPVSSARHATGYPLPAYYNHFAAHSRRAQLNLTAQYTQAAKWQSGAHNAGHRGRENRHAERQRNYMAFQKR